MTEKQRVVTMTVIQYDTVGPWKKKKKKKVGIY